ncbi:TetR/AcrR family transcriptional regulator [Bacterioplanoides sp.]|uniref:TetR/AcrR family transcriptional regulator n=1 Tax=Bacterioplanoides sp. TaxID=2066072 RepID=UPI003B5CD7B5
MKYKDARANRSRQALLDAGIQLLLKNPGASLSQVAEHAGVGRATLYRHFDTREQLIQEIAQDALIQTEELMVPIREAELSGRETVEKMFHALMPMADRFHFLLSLWSIAGDDAEVQQIYNQQLQDLYLLVERMRAEGQVSSGLTTDWVLVTIDTLIYAGWWLIAEGKCTPESAADQALITLFQGITPK